MFGIDNLISVIGLARDFSYDTVFHFGDTGLQFGADLIRGPDHGRHENYAYRQIDKGQRQLAKAQAPKAAMRKEKSLKFEERKVLAEMAGRQQGESIVEHWKRRKALLNAPDKHSRIAEFTALKTKIDRLEASQNNAKESAKLQAQFRAISRASQSASKGRQRQ
jgi:hypothetical protein